MKPIDLFRAGFWGSDNTASIIAGLFAQGQQGFRLPFTNFDSLSQDSAGTLPYTALQQPVGRVLDRSGRGNHASQVTSTARGVVSARVNLLEQTNTIGVAPWVNVYSPTVDIGAAIGPDGLYSMTRLTAVAGPPNQRAQQQFATAANAVYEVSYVIKKINEYGGRLAFYNGGVSVFLASLSFAWVGSAPVVGSASGWTVAPTVTDLGNGHFRIKASFNSSSYTTCAVLAYVDNTLGASYYLGLMDIRPATQAALPYQRVTTATDYDAVGFPKYLRLDGTDDFYTCGGGGSATGFYYSDVIRPMDGARTRRVIWSDRSGNNGYELAINTANKLEFSAGNGTAITTVASTVSAAVTEGKRYEVMDDGTNLSVQIDGSAPVTVARPVVTAGSSTITLYRGASTGYFNGQVTEPIYRAGPPPNAYERDVIRTYQMQKAGML